MNLLPWVEKYRPSKMTDIVSQNVIVDTLKKTKITKTLQHMLLHGPPGTGKCLHPHTPVMLHDSKIIHAMDVKIGDVLMGDDGTPRNVLSISSGTDVMYSIEQAGAMTYVVNSEHILSLVNKYDLKQKIDISVKDYLSRSLQWKNKFVGYKSKKIEHIMDTDKYIINFYNNMNTFRTNDFNKFCDFVFHARLNGYHVFEYKENAEYVAVTKFTNNETNCHEINVNELSHGYYCGFEIDGNKRFLLGDFTVTHNTSTVMAFAKELYGKNYEFMTLVINSSEERGIEIVRNRIMPFVSTDPMISSPNIPYKFVILDEADAMTTDAQAMLRKVIENYSATTRFCLICNYVKKITPALQSRCVCFRFKPLCVSDIYGKINYICENENIKITKDGIDTIMKVSCGDMRKIINTLQSCSLLNSNIDDDTIIECTGYVQKMHVKKIMDTLIHDSFEESCNIMMKIKRENSYSLADIVTELTDIFFEYFCETNFSENHFSSIIMGMSDIENKLVNCSNDDIQMCALIGLFKLHKED
jgi:replication factor C subunit 3/5